jgi:hypothetical protein
MVLVRFFVTLVIRVLLQMSQFSEVILTYSAQFYDQEVPISETSITGYGFLFPVFRPLFYLFEHWWVESILGPLGTVATTGPLYLPRVIVRMENSVEWTVLTGETEVLGENLPRRRFVHHKSHLPDPGRRDGKPQTNHLSWAAPLSE